MKLKEFHLLFLGLESLSWISYESALRYLAITVYHHLYNDVSKQYVNPDDIISDVEALRYHVLSATKEVLTNLIEQTNPEEAKMKRLQKSVEVANSQISALQEELDNLSIFQFLKKFKIKKEIKRLNGMLDFQDVLDYLVWKFVTVDKSGSREVFNQRAIKCAYQKAKELNDTYINRLNICYSG